MQAVKEDKIWATHWVTDSTKEGPIFPARQVFDKIANTAWACGDPGVQFDTIINRWHTTPNSGRINASNPCSEYMSIDDTACNLASINLMRFRQEDGLFDAERFIQASRIFFIAQEIIIDRASYPIKKIAENSHRFRAIGLGYSNLGSLIMSLGLPYDSDEARGLCSVLTALMNGAAYRTSAELAGVVGTFEAFAENREPMLRVIDMHWDAVNRIGNCPNYLKKRAQKLWDEVRNSGSRNGFRNAQATVLAPTGTISFMMDCDTTGIEPDIALVKFKQLAGGGTLKIVNNTVPLALRTLGYTDAEITAIIEHIQDKGTLHEAPHLVDAHLPVFDCAFPTPGSDRCIAWDAHVKMMAAAQPFISGAISKTVNMPNNATAQDIADAYMLGWELGLKALAVYRDGSKGAQPLSATNDSDKSKNNEPETVLSRKEKRKLAGPRRERLPDTRQSVTHKFNVSGHEGYITVGLYPDGRVGELFITMAKEGSTIGGLMDCFGTAISMSLQYGVPLSVYVEKFSHTRFEPMGHTKNPDIPIAKSLVDYIFRWLGRTFLPDMQSVQQDPQNLHSDHDRKDRRCGVVGKAEEDNNEKILPAKIVNSMNSQPLVSVSSGQNQLKPTNHLPSNPNQVNPNQPERTVNISVIDSAVAVIDEPEPFSVLNMNNRFSSQFSATTADEQYGMFQSDAPLCDACGAISVRAGNCYLCYNCGKSMGCS
jgi:ribonucleoside-diphosphate reductase alpha chain